MAAIPQEPQNPVVNEDLLLGFEPYLMRHHISIFGSQLLRVNAYSLGTKSSLFCELYTAAAGACEPLSLGQDDVCCVQGLELVVYFCHFDCLRNMSISLLQEALIAALHFGCQGLEQYATKYACDQLCLETAIQIWQQVRLISNLRVTEVVRAFVLRHFLSLAQRQDFLELSADSLEDLLRDDRLNAWREDQLVAPLLRWLRGRQTPLWDQLRLLASLRFGLLPRPAQLALSSQVEAFQFFDNGFRHSPMFSGMLQPAEPRRTHEGVLVLGGFAGQEATARAYYLEPRRGRWAELRARFWLPEPRLAFACAVLGDSRVVVAGGKRGRWMDQRLDFTVECLCLDLSSPQASWQPMPALHEARSRLSAVVCDSVLYVIGGEDAGGCSDVVEALDAGGGGDWRLRAPLRDARAEPGVASVGGRIFVCGGFLGADRRLPCELLDQFLPAANQWTRLAPMRFQRGCPGLLALPAGGPGQQQQQLLVQGGNPRAEAEKLDCGVAGGSGQQPRWVAAEAARKLRYGSCAACEVDSRWLLVELPDRGMPCRSSALPVDDLAASAAAAAAPAADVTEGATASWRGPDWFGGLNIDEFGLCRVAGMDALDVLLEGATWEQ